MDIFVARQPIFDRGRRVVAYELLFRSGLQNSFGNTDPTVASLSMVGTTLMGFGLDALLGDRRGFFNASRRLLVEEQWRSLPVESAVIEVLEWVSPDEEVIAACAALKAAGYQLALDDFVASPEYEALVEYADIIKIDFLATPVAERAELVQRFKPRGIVMLAEKVETYEDFAMALDAGYDLFQGYFFCKPEMMKGKDLAPFKGNMARLIAEMNRPELDFPRLEELIQQEVSLSVKLLRFLRSASFGWRHEVTSINQALRILGEKAARKWASLVVLTMIGDDKPMELVTTSLVRAQFCEEVGARLPNVDRRGDFFLVGLLSTIDALLDRPLPELLQEMSLSEDVREALRGEATALGECLAMVTAYDQGDFSRAESLAAERGLDSEELPAAYTKSIAWVDEIFASL
ncbi:MAG: HDOD domain-containing protein [Gemmatimonadota bacterium]